MGIYEYLLSHLYAALIALPDGPEDARPGIAEHETMAALIGELRELDMGSGGPGHKFDKPGRKLVYPIDDEATDVFPLARELLGDPEAERLADEFARRMSAEAA